MTADKEDDPFAVFGDDDEQETEQGQLQQQQQQQQHSLTTVRDPECGVLSFHHGTEAALLHFVRNALLSKTSPSEIETSHKRREKLLSLVDEFCYSRHWMMHVGPEKGATLEDFLQQSLDSHMKKLSSSRDNSCPFLLVELGTYCGYSATRMAHLILQRFQSEKREPNFHIFTVDVDKERVEVARQITALGGLEGCISFIVLQDSEKIKQSNELSTVLQEKIQKHHPDDQHQKYSTSAGIDFLFVDHEKTAYLPDLLELEQAGLVRSGTHVAADNVVFFQLDTYRLHMQQLAEKSIVQTRLVSGNLEYVLADEIENEKVKRVEVKDGIELTVYMENP